MHSLLRMYYATGSSIDYYITLQPPLALLRPVLLFGLSMLTLVYLTAFFSLRLAAGVDLGWTIFPILFLCFLGDHGLGGFLFHFW